MDYPYSEEQRLLASTVERLVAERYSFEKRRAIVASEAGWSREIWKAFANLGLQAIPFAEEHGGLGQGPLEVMIVMEALGRGIVVEPYLQSVVLAGALLRHGASEAQKKALIPGIASGEKIYTLAFAEPQGRFNLADLRTTAKKKGGGWVLDGHKAVVYAAPWADGIFVSVRSGGAQRDAQGISIFHVPAGTKGMSLRSYPTIDGGRAAEVMLEGVEVGADALIGTAGDALPLLERVIDEGIAAVCAEAVGAMEALNERTLEYSKTRVAFGNTLSKYQVLQHRMVDMRVSYAYAAATAQLATLRLSASAKERARAASIAKYHACKDGRFVAQNAVQLHGAIGVTDELDVGHYFRRLTVIDFLFGNADFHLRRYSALTRSASTAQQAKAA
jgi:alkylation response protein AidB-like acyl-CoA dehydrogenase